MEGAPAILNKTLIQVLILLAAVINGFGAGLLWVSQGKYISDCACEENQGVFNSTFWAFFMSTQILGNITAGVVLGTGQKQSTLFVIFAVLSVCGAMIFLFLGEPTK